MTPNPSLELTRYGMRCLCTQDCREGRNPWEQQALDVR